METLQNIFQAEIIQRLGWTLVHFIWQAIGVSLILAIVLRLLQRYAANLRYIITCMALSLIVLIPAVTIKMVDVSVYTAESAKPIPANLPEAVADAQAIVEMPQIESPPAHVVATPRISLKDKFVETVEPALPYIVVGWLVGVFGLSLWHLGGWTQLQRLRRKMVKQVTPALKAKLQQLSNALGIQKTIGLVESALVQVPTVVGHLKPVILLPASALTGLSSEHIEAILAHELAHIKRHDYLVNMLQTVVEILGFYHPAVWWISHKIRVERENCCDDLAVSISGDRVWYAKALTTMEEIRAGRLGLAVAASGGSLFDRIRRLPAKGTVGKEKVGWIPSAIAILLIMALVIPASWALSGKHQEKTNLQLSEVRVYQVNRSVSKFPDNDFSTPEAAYAAINKIADRSDNSQWAKVSVERLAKRFLQSKSRKPKPDPEWNKVLQNAQILEVRVYKENYAMVIAKLPQEFSSKKIRSPIDIRSFEFEDDRWLNAGNNRCWTVGEARAQFIEACEFRDEEKVKKLIRKEKLEEALKNPEIIRKAAKELFEKIQKVDYEQIVESQRWGDFGIEYTVRSYWQKHRRWMCETFKDNPIVQVELGKVFHSDEEIMDSTDNPSIHYKVTLKDGGILQGDLPFYYSFEGDQGHWVPVHGIDWHLQENPIKSPAGQIEGFKQELEEPVTVHIDKSPDGSRLTVQYAAIAVCKSANVPYNWDKSAKLADPQRRQYIDPVNIKNKIASQTLADLLGPEGLLYGIDANGVYLYNPETTIKAESHIHVEQVNFNPVRQGKNVLRVKAKNTSDTKQLFAIHIYTRSVDYGPHGVGWGTVFFETINPNKSEAFDLAYKIQGPVTEKTYIRLKFYNPESRQDYDYKDPFHARVYKHSDLPKPQKPRSFVPADQTVKKQVSAAFDKIRAWIGNGDYEKAWQSFTEQYQKSEYQVRGFKAFKLHMEPKHPLHAAFHWPKENFIKLHYQQVFKVESENNYILKAVVDSETWQIYFVEEDRFWKIDDITGYTPSILGTNKQNKARRSEKSQKAISFGPVTTGLLLARSASCSSGDILIALRISSSEAIIWSASSLASFLVG